MKVKRAIVFLLFIFNTFTANAVTVNLSLTDAIQRMMDSNPTIKSFQLQLEQSEINYDISWYTFWLPTFGITADSTYQYSFGSLPFTSARNNSQITHRGPPSNSVTVGLGEYVIFDFFKQRAAYDKAKIDFERAKQVFQESVRSERFNLIGNYFDAKISQVKFEAAERSYTIAQAIHELVISRKSLGKATDEEVSSAFVDLNSAKIEFVQKKNELEQKTYTLHTTLNTPLDTKFNLTTEIPFMSVRLDEQELFEIFKKMSPTARQLDVQVSKSEIDTSLAEKNRLPLPKISIQMLSLNYTNGFAGGNSPTYNSGSSSSGTIDFSTSINLSLPIFGPQGLFSERTVRQQYIQRELTEIQQHMNLMNAEIQIKQLIISIRGLEQNIVTQKESFNQSQSLLNSYFKRASSGVDRLQLRDAILQARQSQFDYYDNLLNHIRAKNDLAIKVGLDRLPGDVL